MAHPKRKGMVNKILEEIPNAKVVWDRVNSIHDTWERSWLSYDKEADYHLVIQDDGVPCKNFVKRVNKLIRENPLPLYNFHCRKRDDLIRASKHSSNGYFEYDLWGGVAVCMKTDLIEDMCEWCMKYFRSTNFRAFDDIGMKEYFSKKGIKTVYPIPSLVDHIGEETLIPHLYSKRSLDRLKKKGREAIHFIDNIFTDKKVCLIGASPSILKLEQSDYINKFDIICRINWALPVSKHLEKCTGNRCDVLYIYPEVEPNSFWEGVQIRMKTLNNRTFKKYTSKHRDLDIRRINLDTYHKLARSINCVPNMGLLAMSDILSFDPKMLYITGFSFYQDKEDPFYKGYNNPNFKDVKELKGNIFGHDQQQQMKYFFSYISRLKNVTVDNNIKKMRRKFLGGLIK